MHRQRVEQLVGDEDALERRRQRHCRGGELPRHIAQNPSLRPAGVGARFDEMEPNGLEQGGVPLSQRAENVGREPCVSRACFYEIERWTLTFELRTPNSELR